MEPDRLSRELTDKLEAARMTAETLSLDAQLARDTVGRWIRGATVPTLAALRAVEDALSDRLGCPVDLAAAVRERRTTRQGDRKAPMRDSGRRRSQIWGSEVPFRNPHFTGREDTLGKLRTQLTSDANDSMRQALAVLQGLGGIGKTELAAEYAYRYSGDYDVVWWIRADQEDSIRAALIGLGRQLGLQDFRPEERDYSSRLVLDALRVGEPYERWLLIFDDMTQPGIIGRYVPLGLGHVIITSRLTRWQRELRTDGIQLTEFDLGETVQLLRDRIPRLAYHPRCGSRRPRHSRTEDARRQADAERLAQTLGNLPLAAEHAAAYLNETGEPVDYYIAAFEHDAHELFSRVADLFATQVAVETTWSVSRRTLSPEALALFRILAFFPAEPISEEVLVQPGRMQDLPSELAAVLCSNTEFRRAGHELARFSLAKINGNVIQMHNVVQAVTRGHIEREDPAAAATFRDAVQALLDAARLWHLGEPGFVRPASDPMAHISQIGTTAARVTARLKLAIRLISRDSRGQRS